VADKVKGLNIMKRSIIFAGCCVILMGLVGCQGPSVNNSGVEVIIEGGGEFPRSLAGTWKDQESSWQVTLAPDGSIVSLVNAIGSSMVIAEGGLFEDGPVEGTFLCFVFGPCYTNYNPATRELGVTVTLDDFYMQLPDEVFEADMKYHITGPVSKDSSRWDAKLFVYVFPKGGQPTDPNTVSPQILVFNKVENVQPEPPKNR